MLVIIVTYNIGTIIYQYFDQRGIVISYYYNYYNQFLINVPINI